MYAGGNERGFFPNTFSIKPLKFNKVATTRRPFYREGMGKGTAEIGNGKREVIFNWVLITAARVGKCNKSRKCRGTTIMRERSKITVHPTVNWPTVRAIKNWVA